MRCAFLSASPTASVTLRQSAMTLNGASQDTFSGREAAA
jgi:hypothetical protein